MKTPDRIEGLIAHLFPSESTQRAVHFTAADHAAIARKRTTVAALGVLSTVLTGEPSMIENKAAAFLTCDECAAELPAYVEAWLAGDEVNSRFPILSRHLRACPDCAAQARELYQLLQAETTAATPTAPTYLTFAQARRQQQTAEQSTPLWQRTTDHLFQLRTEIAMVLKGTRALFGDLGAGLTPRLVPATVLRGTETEMTELLELPHPESDLLIKIRMGAVHNGVGALALQFSSLTESRNLSDISVTLRDDDGSLLERTRSDRDGLALFDDLETGKYQLQIEHTDQTWLVGITVH